MTPTGVYQLKVGPSDFTLSESVIINETNDIFR